MTIAKAKKLLTSIDVSKNKIAKERDKLRVICNELFDCIDSLDSGLTDLELGEEYISDGLDKLKIIN